MMRVTLHNTPHLQAPTVCQIAAIGVGESLGAEDTGRASVPVSFAPGPPTPDQVAEARERNLRICFQAARGGHVLLEPQPPGSKEVGPAPPRDDDLLSQ